jgi:hypothetical protein
MGFSSIIPPSWAASASQGIVTSPHSTRRFAYSWASPYIRAGLGKMKAVIAADGAGTEDEDPHGGFL